MAIDLSLKLPPIIESYTFWMEWLKNNDIYGKHFLLLKNTKQELLSNNNGNCPFCNNTGLVWSGKVLCICHILDYMETKKWKYESSWIPSTINSLKAINNPPGAGALTTTIKEYFVDFLETMEKWIYLYGGFGSGKTHLMHALKSNLRGIAMYVDASDLSSKIYSSLNTKNLDNIENELEAAHVLLIDDFGAEHSSDFLYSTLFRIINRRYSLGVEAPTIVTSNLTFDELASSPNANMRRIGSRLGDVNLVYHLASKQMDYREIKR